MKITKLLIIVVLVAVSLVSSTPTVRAQTGTGDDKLDAIMASIQQVATKLNDKGYTVVNITIDKGFQGETYETSRTLFAHRRAGRHGRHEQFVLFRLRGRVQEPQGAVT